MLIATAAITLLSTHQSTPTLTIPPQMSTVGSVVRELSIASKENMSVEDPSIRDKGVYVSFNNISLQSIRKELAEVVKGEWVSDDGTLKLIPLPNRLKLEQDVLLDTQRRDIKLFQATITDEMVKPLDRNAVLRIMDTLRSLSKSPVSHGYYTEAAKINAQLPIGRTQYRLMRIMSADEFVSLFPEDRRVFTLNPNSKQFPLPKEAKNIVKQCVAELKLLAEEQKKLESESLTFRGIEGLLFNNGEIDEKTCSLRLIFRRNQLSFRDTLWLDIQILDGSNIPIATSNLRIPRTPVTQLSIPTDWRSLKIPSSTSLEQSLSDWYYSKTPLPQAAESDYVRTIAQEPLQLFQPSALRLWADTLSLSSRGSLGRVSVIACLNDPMFSKVANALRKPLTLADYAQLVAEDHKVRITRERFGDQTNDWLIIQPARADTPADRTLLGKTVIQYAKSGQLTNEMELSKSLPTFYSPLFPESIFPLISERVVPEFHFYDALFPFAASLFMRSRLQDGALTFTMNQLTPQEKFLLERGIFSPSPSAKVSITNVYEDGRPYTQRLYMDKEITSIWPRNPNDLTVKLTVSTGNAVFAPFSPPPFPFSHIYAGKDFLSQMARQTLDQGRDVPSLEDRFAFGNNTIVGVDILFSHSYSIGFRTFTADVLIHDEFNNPYLPDDWRSSQINYSQLPQSFRDDFAKQLDAQRRMRQQKQVIPPL